MAIMSRILRLWKADLHGVMDQLEDKPLLLKQYLREMESSLQQKRTRFAQLRRNADQLQRNESLRVDERGRLEQDIALAVKKGKDDIARMLIRKRLTLEAEGQHLGHRRGQIEEEAEALERLIGEQQERYERLSIKVATHCQQSAEQRTAMGDEAIWSDPVTMAGASDEEVEMALLRCKEAFAREGGAP